METAEETKAAFDHIHEQEAAAATERDNNQSQIVNRKSFTPPPRNTTDRSYSFAPAAALL